MHRDVKVPDGDVLIHAGDITGQGELDTIHDFNEWLGELPHKHKIVIAGNHDFCFPMDSPEWGKEKLSNCTYLQDEFVVVEGFKIWGSPWQPWFGGWHFNLDRGPQIKEKWDLIPLDTDILVTHGPPDDILDWCFRGNKAGCVDLLNHIRKMKNLKMHVFGHIHESRGVANKDGVKFVNASTCTLGYRPTNQPFVVEL